MSERPLNIKLDIAGKPYEMTIDARNEEVYRLAAREINNRLAAAQQTRVDGFGVQDYLAIVAVDLMISNIRLMRRSSVEEGDLKALSELAERLSKHLEK
ncbi:MAG: cell division protein ZapA [Alistipes sp.]|nr:cell division protein ZapA [Alistipes sp.]